MDFSELDKMLGEAASGSAEKPNLKKDDTGETDPGDGKGTDSGTGDGTE
jgi:hypothetical protein